MVDEHNGQFETAPYAYSPNYASVSSPVVVASEERFKRRSPRKLPETHMSSSSDVQMMNTNLSGAFDPFAIGRKLLNCSFSSPVDKQVWFFYFARMLSARIVGDKSLVT